MSYENSRRRPSRAAVLRLCEALALDSEATSGTLAAAGFEAQAVAATSGVALRRITWPALQAEVAACPWPALVVNEHIEIMAWSHAANRVAELDIGVDLPTQADRHLLRMALRPHFRARLMNWDEVISVLIGMYRFDMMEVMEPEKGTLYFNALVEFVARNHPDEFQHLILLWQSAQPWPDGTRIVFPVWWRTGRGQDLRFSCTVSPWSDFDAEGAFDWHPADAATWRWLSGQGAMSGSPAAAPPRSRVIGPAVGMPPWNVVLRSAREAVSLSRYHLAQRVAGVSEHTIYSYEAGRRAPQRDALVALAHAMELDGATTNLLLEGAGFEPEPSDWALFLSGEPVRASPRRYRRQGNHRTWPEIQAEIALHPWPCLVVNDRCEIMCGNDALARVTGVRVADAPGTRNLLDYVTDRLFRESVANWSEVVGHILPGSLAPYAHMAGSGPGPEAFRVAIDSVRRRDPGALRDLVDAWQAAPRRPAARVVFPLTWLTDGTRLRFNCHIAPWNVYDPAWAMDWHPADAATWEWLGEPETRS